MDVEGVIDRIKDFERLRFQNEVAELLGGNRTAVTRWVKQGNIPNQYLLDYAEKRELSLDWLIFGIGAPDRGDTLIHENSGRYNLAMKPEAMYRAAEALYAACGRAEPRPSHQVFRVMLRAFTPLFLAGGEMDESELDQYVQDMLDLQKNKDDAHRGF